MALVLRPPSVGDALSDKLRDLGTTRKRVAIATGVFVWLAVGLGLVTLACVLDVWLHLSGLARALALVTILITGGVLWLRGITRPLAVRTDPLAVALELEDKHPTLNDALASAVSFLERDDAEERGISNRLESAAVKTALRLADRHEFEQIIPMAAFWRAGWALAILLAAIIPLILLDTSRAATAVVRLLDPFGIHPWPTKTQVEILVPAESPTRIPKGEDFELKFAVRGELPDRATLTIRMSFDEFQEDYPLTLGNDPNRPAAAVVSTRIEATRIPESFQFRITANDGETSWQRVEVVPPPRLVPLEGRPSPQFRVSPPAYTGLPSSNLPDGSGVIEIPVGSVVQLRAATDTPLSAASLAYRGDTTLFDSVSGLAALGHLNALSGMAAQLLASAIGTDIPLALDPGGQVLSGTFVPSVSGLYALKLTDRTGLTGHRLLEIRLVPDPAPTVVLLRPAAGRDPAVLTPQASIPLQVSAADPVYALRRMFLDYRVGRDGKLQMLPLLDLRSPSTGLMALTGTAPVAVSLRPTSGDLRLDLPLTRLTREDGSPLRDGDLLILTGAADDWDDVTPVKNPGRSEPVEIRIASSEAIEAWLQRELSALRPELLRLRDQQQAARQKTMEVQPQSEGVLSPSDRGLLLDAEQLQRQVRAKISDPRDGLRAKTSLLRETLRANNLPDSNVTSRLQAIAEELDRLSDRDLAVIEPYLTDARQLGSQSGTPKQKPVLEDLLKRAARHQQAVDDGLSAILDWLAIWGGASDVRGDARILRDQLKRLADEVERLSEKVPVGQAPDRLNPAQRNELERAAGRTELATEQATNLLARAARLASEKERQSAAARQAVGEKEREAAALRERAAQLPPGQPEKSALNARASSLQAEADDLKSLVQVTEDETRALRAGIEAAGGQDLPEQLRAASQALRSNRQAEAATLQRSAAARLANLAEALAEKERELAPELMKTLKTAADELDALGAAQDQLQQRTQQANQIADPTRRASELKTLAEEQEKLIQKTREVLQRLTRERADSAARQIRSALDKMETARDDLERGEAPTRPQMEATESLDNARDTLDAATAAAPQQLADEKRRKIADRVDALVERQKAAIAETERLHGLVRSSQKWERPVLASYADLEERIRAIAADVRTLSEQELAPLPVLVRLVSDAAKAMDTAADKARIRREDALDADPLVAFDPQLELANDRQVLQPMNRALRRLQQLADVLKPEPPGNATPQPPASQPSPKATPMPPPASAAAQDVIPPLAQLKVLRALQAELNEKTAEFAKAHPDPDKLTDEEREELKELEQAQREIATLFEQLSRLLNEQPPPPANQPDPPEEFP
jgi:DNA repair exonuclease SbcCD ATPase subunit